MQGGTTSDCSRVGIALGGAGYCSTPPFSPADAYPEYPHGQGTLAAEPNAAYDTVRRALVCLGCDGGRYGQRDWSPLRMVVHPGDVVVLKPNFVRDFRETHAGHADCLFTHGSIIRAVVDYVYMALEGRGRIVIADAPQNDADFDAIRTFTGLTEIQEFYRRHAGFGVEVYDLRPEKAAKVDGVIVGHTPLAGDPAGYTRVNLGSHSAFVEVNHLCHLLYGSEYDTRELYDHQHDDIHEYLVSKTVLQADCVISLPKLKTHKKVGLTVNMKNLVGINGNKNWLPHHREGTPGQGGDQFADDGMLHRIERVAASAFKRVFPTLGPFRRWVARPAKAVGKSLFGDTNRGTIRSGNWYGNDTTWRMVMDLNRIAMYADAGGGLHDSPARRFFSVVDGVIGGEGNGPLDPTPRRLGAVLAGFNAVAVDLAAARVMGFDYSSLPVLRRALEEHDWPLASFGFQDVEAVSNDGRLTGKLAELDAWDARFEPHFGWKGHVELSQQADPRAGGVTADAAVRS